MKTASSKNKTSSKKSATKSTRKKADSALSICPVNGAGWCPYPFSAAQLKRRLKRMQEEQKEDEDLSVSHV